MPASTRKRRSVVKPAKSSAVVVDSDSNVEAPVLQKDDKSKRKAREVSSDEEKPLSKIVSSSKKQKAVVSDNESDVQVVGKRGMRTQSPTLKKSSEMSDLELAPSSPPLSAVVPVDDPTTGPFTQISKSDGKKAVRNTNDSELPLFRDSDCDGPDGSDDDSDAMHSTHSLEIGTPTKAATKLKARDTTSTYLDSYPAIVDSGRKRNKEIQNDPMTLGNDVIDPMLRNDHKSLPALRRTSVTPFVRYGQLQPEPESNVALGYEKIFLNMVAGPGGKEQLAAAVKFTLSLPFVNPSRASPDLVVSDGSRLCFKAENSKRGKNAVFLTTGLIVDSQLKYPADSIITPGHKIRQVVLLPFTGEIQRLLAYIGTAFGTEEYVCLLDSGSLLITTRKEGAYANTSAPSSPLRSRLPAGLLAASPVKLGTPTDPLKGRSSHFYPSLGFKDNVPVYDIRGRPDFLFNKESLQNITSLPLYNNGKTDLPPSKYIATVGYTVGSWRTKPDPSEDTTKLCASLNIQFVIVLGKIDPQDFA